MGIRVRHIAICHKQLMIALSTTNKWINQQTKHISIKILFAIKIVYTSINAAWLNTKKNSISFVRCDCRVQSTDRRVQNQLTMLIVIDL